MFGETKKMWFDDDDSRGCPSGWVRARDVFEAINLIISGEVVEMSLDHDIETPCFGYGESKSMTGEDLVKWMANNLPPSKWPATIRIHSHNEIGARNMEARLQDFAPRFVRVITQKFVVGEND